jgi:hypothetical protein
MSTVQETVDWLRGLRKAFRLTFEVHQPANVTALQNLQSFCFATRSCAVPGDRDRTLLNEGRREVWLHLNEYLHLNEEQLYQLKIGGTPTTKEQSNE